MLFVLLIYKYNLGPHQYNSHVVLFECGCTVLKEYVILAGRTPRLGRGSSFILGGDTYMTFWGGKVFTRHTLYSKRIRIGACPLMTYQKVFEIFNLLTLAHIWL